MRASAWLGLGTALIGAAGAARAQEGGADGAGPDGEDEIYEAVAEVRAPPREPTRRELDAEELTRVPGTSGDPLRAVEILPGVSRSSDGAPILRGANGNESLTLIDGTPVPFLFHFGGVRSVGHPRLIDRVDVYPGNFSTRYGRAVGGLVEAHLRDPREDGWHGELELSLIDSSALLEGPIGDGFALALGARRSNIDFVFDHFVPQDTFDVVAAPLYWDYETIAALRLGRRSKLRLTLLGSRDAITLAFSDPNAENAALRGTVAGSLEFHRAVLAFEDGSGPVRWQLQANVGVQGLRQEVGPNSRAYFDVVDFGGRGEWTFSIASRFNLTAGFDVQGQSFTGAYRGSAAPQIEGGAQDPDNVQDLVTIDRTHFYRFQPAAYLEAQLYPTSRWSLIPGLRVDHYREIDATTVDARLSQRYTLSDALTLRSGIGWYSQPPEYYETIAGIGNPELEPYHALQLSAGAEVRLGTAVSLDLEGFYKRLVQRVVATPGSVAPHFENDGRGRIAGLELGATVHDPGGLDAQLAYTLSRSERQDRDEAWRLFDRDQTHVLSLALGYPLGAGWTAGARFRYVTGDPVTPVTGAVYDAGADLYYPLHGRPGSERDAAFHELDLRLEKAFSIGPGRLSVYLDVQNVYAAQNAEGYTYSYDYSKREAANASPFFPNLGLRGAL